MERVKRHEHGLMRGEGRSLVLRIDLYYEHVCLMILNGYEMRSLVIIIHSYIDAVLPS